MTRQFNPEVRWNKPSHLLLEKTLCPDLSQVQLRPRIWSLRRVLCITIFFTLFFLRCNVIDSAESSVVSACSWTSLLTKVSWFTLPRVSSGRHSSRCPFLRLRMSDQPFQQQSASISSPWAAFTFQIDETCTIKYHTTCAIKNQHILSSSLPPATRLGQRFASALINKL